MEDGFDDFAVGAGEDLAENGAGDLDKESIALCAIEARGLEPGGIGVDADPGFDQIEKFIPDILSFFFAANLSSSRHQKKPNLNHFHRCVKTVERQFLRYSFKPWSSCPRGND